jgi:hypothetical protein
MSPTREGAARGAVASALALVAALAGSVARAQQPPPSATPAQQPGDAARREQAREHFQRGVEFIGQSRWLEALAELRLARELRVTPAVAFNLGLAQRAVGRNREAIESFREYIRLAGAGGNADLVARADGYIRELAAGIGRLELRIEPPTASVAVDGASITPGTISVEVDPGRHVVSVNAEGFANESRVIEVRGGGVAVVVLRMVPTLMAARLRVESNLADALVRIDGSDMGFGTVEEMLRPGRHTIEVRATGRATFRRDFFAVAGARATVRAALQLQGRTVFASPWFWLGVTVVAAGLTVGGIFLFSYVEAPYRGVWGVVPDALHLVRGLP